MLFYYVLMIIISYLIEIRYSNQLNDFQQKQQSLLNTINFELYK